MAARFSHVAQRLQGTCIFTRSVQTQANYNVKPVTSSKMSSRCKAGRNKVRPVKPNPKNLMIASNVKSIFEENGMVAVFQYGDLNTTEWNDIRHKLAKNDIGLKVFPNRVTHKALENSVYKAIQPLFSCTTCVIYSKQPQVKNMVNAVKKQSKLELLGAKVENRLLSKSNAQEFAKLPSLQELHGQLIQHLQQPGSNLNYLVQQNQRLLSSNLTQYVDQKQQK